MGLLATGWASLRLAVAAAAAGDAFVPRFSLSCFVGRAPLPAVQVLWESGALLVIGLAMTMTVALCLVPSRAGDAQ